MMATPTMTIKRARRVVLVLLLASISMPGAEKPDRLAAAPPEMRQFAFLDGAFAAKVILQGPQGVSEFQASWTGRYTLGGHAFEDDFVGAGLRGTTWRTYDPKQERWINIWLPAGAETDGPRYFYGKREGDVMRLHATGSDGRGDFLDRLVFSNITIKGFRWSLDRSHDDGKTWTNRIVVTATRVP